MSPSAAYSSSKLSLRVVTALVLAVTYAVLVLLLPGISYGPIQVRVADILSPLPYVMGLESVLGLTLGTLISNVLSPYGVWDIAIGTLCTFTYTLIDWVLGRVLGYRRWTLAVVAIVNSVTVGLYIGALLIGVIAEGGDPAYLFILLTGESLIPMSIGSFLLVPTVRRYLKRFG
ncbi:MAG: QueT transporter family protein [Desulfurococcaceae archaeon]|nr:QueT transporter family protein [Desulfurococcaceae archaeon]